MSPKIKGGAIEDFKIPLFPSSKIGCENQPPIEATKEEKCKVAPKSLQIPYKTNQNKIENRKSDENQSNEQNADRSSQNHPVFEARIAETGENDSKTCARGKVENQ